MQHTSHILSLFEGGMSLLRGRAVTRSFL